MVELHWSLVAARYHNLERDCDTVERGLHAIDTPVSCVVLHAPSHAVACAGAEPASGFAEARFTADEAFFGYCVCLALPVTCDCVPVTCNSFHIACCIDLLTGDASFLRSDAPCL